MKKIQVITLFPDMFKGVMGSSMMWKAQDKKIAEITYIDLREFGLGQRRTVDDTPYGGGDGMLLRIEPMVAAIEYAKAQSIERGALSIEGEESPKSRTQGPIVMLPTPRGKIFKQSDAKRLAADDRDIIILCPRYEGYDERITDWIDEQFCIGQYVLTGGELPAMIVIDSVVRLLDGVLGGEKSAEIESFQSDDKYIEFPQYTRPEEYMGKKVPEVLLSGNHAVIEKWRQTESR